MRSRARILRPGGAVDQECRGIDRERHVGELGLNHLQLGQRPAEQLPPARTRERLVERPARKPERRSADRGAEHIERGHGDLEALARRAEQLRARHPAVREAQGRERMRRDQLDTLGDLEARRRGIDDERGQTLGRRRLPGAREHDIEVGDAAVRDPGLGAVQDEAGAIRLRRGGDRRDVGAGFALGQRERPDLAAVGDRRQPGTALVLGPEQTDRAAAEPLHGKREIGEAGKARQDLAHEAERAHVQAVVHAAVGGRHHMAQKPGLGEMRDEHPTGGVELGSALVQIGQSVGGKALDFVGQRAVALVEERPGEVAAIGHGRRRVQLPANSGRFFARNARYARRKSSVCMQIA